MRKLLATAYGKGVFCLFLTLLSATLLRAQITVTSPMPNNLTFNSAAGAVVFGVKNTNAANITITDVGNYVPSGFSGTLTLWYRTTGVTGAPVAINTTNGWVQAAQKAITATADGITPIFTGLSITIPANTTYRFAISGPAGSPYYGGAGSTANKYEGGGLEVYVQNNANSPGYGGAFPGPPTTTPVSFIGSITFVPTVACTEPPVPGTAVTSATTVCEGVNFNLNVIGSSIGTGQTYQWQKSTDNSTWTNVGTASSSSGLTTSQTATYYYRAAVTCGSNTAYSASVQVNNSPRVSGTFTINKNAPAGSGNFQSFNEAYNYIKCGVNNTVVFNVVAGSGPYDEQLIMQPIPGTSATNTVTFNGNGNTLSYLSSNANERAVIKLEGADYVTFDNLVITAKGTATNQYGYGVQLLNDADNNTISNCTINIEQATTTTNYAGIVVNNAVNGPASAGTPRCDYNTFSGNTITGGYCGISLVGSTAQSNAGNQVLNNIVKEFYLYGIYVDGSFNILVEGNTISRPTRTAVSDFYGINFSNLSTRANVTRNTITNPFGAVPNSTNIFYGIIFNGVGSLVGFENLVTNNRIFNITGSGNAYGLHNAASHSVWYYHNTISMDGSAPASAASHQTRGFSQNLQANGLEFKNNIITISRGGPGIKTGIYMNTNTTTMVSDRNDIFIASTTGSRSIGYWNTFQSTLASWRAATGQDANSASSDPFYTNLASGDLKPQNGSLDNMGVNVGIAKDFDGVVRSTATPDMGAYEFAAAACVTPPVAGTAAVSETPVCSESPVMLTVTGNTFGLSQVFQWQSSPSATGPFTNFGSVVRNPDTAISAPPVSLYYRLAVTCGGQTAYSEPVLLTITQPLPAGTYTINKNAAASATNFVSFNAAKAAMSCGITGAVVFNVEPGSGTYNEQLILDPIRGTSDVNTITFNGNGNTIKFSTTDLNERAVVKLNGADYVTMDNLTVDATGTGTGGWGIQLLNDADNNTIRNCTVNADKAATSNNFAGIAINSASNQTLTLTGTGLSLCDNNTIIGNTINGGFNGITVAGSTTAYIKNNRIVNNKINDFYTSGIHIGPSLNTLVEGNEIARPSRTNSPSTGAQGINSFGVSEGMRISKNRIRNPFDVMTNNTQPFYGILLNSVDAPVTAATIVSNNLIYNINGSGAMHGLYNNSTDNVVYYHNTVSLDYAANTTSQLTYGFYQTVDAEGIELKNNLFTVTRGGTGFRYGLYFNTATTRFTSDFNNIYLVAGPSSFVGYLTANRATLDDWKAASGKDLNSSAVDPIYTNAAVDNFKPLAAAMDNRGTGVGVNTDFDGTARSASTPDIGAYEFAVPPCTTPPAAGATTASPSNACMGTPVLLSLSGNTFGSGMSFQWQYATAAAGPYLPLGAPKVFPDTVIEASATLYYRAAVTCSGNTQYSAPKLVSLNSAFPSGVYTIDSNPANAPDFPSFAKAVEALECGITGPVTFKVAAGTYTEQVRMHKIGGAGSNSRVTFQSASGDPASVVLQFTGTSTNNYVLKLDSASYVTYKDLTVTALSAANGRAIELANTASFDSLVNLAVNAPATTVTTTAAVGIYANGLRGSNNVIRGNAINGGSNGIYLRGISETSQTALHVIDGNTVNGAYNYGIQANFASRIRISNNTVSVTAPSGAAAFGVYAGYCDTAYQVVGNKVTIAGAAGTAHGIRIDYCDGTAQERGKVAGNTVLATTNNTSTLYGLTNNYSTYNNTVNNVVSIKTTEASSYALFSNMDDNNNYYNNSIYSASTVSTAGLENYAGFFFHVNSKVTLRNNIFAHNGGGAAYFTNDPSNTASDYNMLYTSGTTLVRISTPAASYANLQAWRDAYGWDMNSIVYKPAFVSDVDLRPNVADPEVWAIHGRGEQIAGNDYDFNNNPRPTTLVAGVPDLGAYEFMPTSVPPVLTAIPAAPAAGITQTFMMGTDTVSKITWGTSVPATISIRRYSGVTPPGLTPATPHMYYYTDVQTTGGSALNFSKKDFFIDPWQGLIPHQYQVRLGRTNAGGAWTMGASSTVDTTANVITETGLTQLFQFTGLVDVNAVPPLPPVITQQVDSAHMGKRFWVGYLKSFDFTNNGNFNMGQQEMVLYLSAGAQPATVTVKVNGTSWVRTYSIPANTVIASDNLPKAGAYDARLIPEGRSDRGISIESDVPIAAYAHINNSYNSGATMLLPVGTYGYEYYTLSLQQGYTTSAAHASFQVIADRDNTTVEITPTNPTFGGRAPGVPFTVTLNRGEVYQVLGAYIGNTGYGYDLAGSKVKAVPNADGKCYPFAVFSGSSATRIGCGTIGNDADLLMAQVIPTKAWGTRYLTAPTSNAPAASSTQTNIYRVMVQDPQTVVKVNGSILTGLQGNRFYQFESNLANYIEADKPVLVGQFMTSSNGIITNCVGSTSNLDGDPELFMLSALDQGVKKAGFYRSNQRTIQVNYLTLTIPTAGLASLTIDGSNTFDHTYAHPNLPGYTVVVKRWDNTPGQSWVQSDSAFTGIVYGEGNMESYGYNLGMTLKVPKSQTAAPVSYIRNTFNTTSGSNSATCTKTPFKVYILVPVKPTTLNWKFSQVADLSPNADVTLSNPTGVDTVINGVPYYKYTLGQEYTFSKPGTYTVPVTITTPEFETCSNTLETALTINVVAAPQADFTVDYTSCIGDVARFSGTAGAGFTATQWDWNLGDGSKATIQNPTRQYATLGNYDVRLKLVTQEGCLGDTTKKVKVNDRPTVDVVKDTLSACSGSSVAFAIKAPETGVTYNWYMAATGGTLAGTGITFTVPVTAAANYYVEAVGSGCASTTRRKVTALLLTNLATPVVVVDSVSTNMIRFKWAAVAGGTSYEVSTDGGTTWTEPSGALTHTVTGLVPLQSVTIIVRAKGGCQPVQSLAVTGKALVDQVFVPNSFSPNGDGLNDVLQVYGYVVKDMQFQVFNQWGEKIHESRDMKRAWDGTQKGKLQPSGVYLYVCKLTLNDGSVITKKGSINLVR